MNKRIYLVLVFLFWAGILILAPLVIIGALNNLTGHPIPYTVQNWFSVFCIGWMVNLLRVSSPCCKCEKEE